MRFLSIISTILLAIFHPSIAQEAVDDAQALKINLDKLNAELSEVETRIDALNGEDRKVFEQEALELTLAELDSIYQLAELVVKQETDGTDVTELRAYTLELLAKVPQIIAWALAQNQKDIEALKAQKDDASSAELGILEEEISVLVSSVDTLYETKLAYLEELKKLNTPDERLTQSVKEDLKLRARLMAGRLKKHSAERSVIKKRLNASADDSDLALQLGAKQIAIDSHIASLERMIKLMELLDLPVSSYRTLIVTSTNDLSRGLEVSALAEIANKGWAILVRWTKDSIPHVVFKGIIFFVIVYVFWLLSKVVERFVKRAVNAPNLGFSHLLRNMMINLTGNFVILLGIILALTQMGVSVGPMIAGLGVAGFILGFALQETLGNFAAGLMILFYRPFDEGDMVEAAGVFGKVHRMSLVSTTILTIDNKTLIVPNGKIWGDVICNVTNENIRRVDLVLGVSYDAKIPHVEDIIQTMVNAHPKILKDPAPTIKVHEWGDSSVNFIVRPWVATEDYWNVHWDLTRDLKIKFDEEGIGIPYPQRDVHHYYPDGGKPKEIEA